MRVGPISASSNGSAVLSGAGAAGFGTSRAYSSLLRGGGGEFSAVSTARTRGYDDLEFKSSFAGGSPRGRTDLPGMRGLALRWLSLSRRCLTIASEGRETWTALSLRGRFRLVWLGAMSFPGLDWRGCPERDN